VALSVDREFIAIGLTNFLSSFLGGIASTASFSRSALNAQVGCKSHFSGMVASLFVLLTVTLATSLLYYVPQPGETFASSKHC
jgi:SulP family sulfate permease